MLGIEIRTPRDGYMLWLWRLLGVGSLRSPKKIATCQELRRHNLHSQHESNKNKRNCKALIRKQPLVHALGGRLARLMQESVAYVFMYGIR